MLLCNISHNLSFADAQFLAKFFENNFKRRKEYKPSHASA
jgi:hypothetical protein